MGISQWGHRSKAIYIQSSYFAQTSRLIIKVSHCFLLFHKHGLKVQFHFKETWQLNKMGFYFGH